VSGRIALGLIIDRLNARAVSALLLVSQAVALLVLAGTNHTALILIACGAFGLSVGNIITLPAIVIQQEFDARAFSLLVGLSIAICQVAYSLGPGILGVLHDLTGTYTAPLLFCATLEMLAATIILSDVNRLSRRSKGEPNS
jgi:predicted MFS family arabinose efflux permease